MVKVGHSANAAPASSRVGRDPMPRASASLTRPQNATRDQQRHPQPLGQPHRHVQQVARSGRRRPSGRRSRCTGPAGRRTTPAGSTDATAAGRNPPDRCPRPAWCRTSSGRDPPRSARPAPATHTSTAQRRPARSAASPQPRRRRRGGRLVRRRPELGLTGEVSSSGSRSVVTPAAAVSPGDSTSAARAARAGRSGTGTSAGSSGAAPRPRRRRCGDAPGPGHRPDTEREHRLPEEVLGRPAVAAQVAAGRVVAAQVVEGGISWPPHGDSHAV